MKNSFLMFHVAKVLPFFACAKNSTLATRKNLLTKRSFRLKKYKPAFSLVFIQTTN